MSEQHRILQYDYIKGIAILCVIIHHWIVLYPGMDKLVFLHFHVGQAVPLFLLVSIVMRYKKFSNIGKINHSHTWKEVKRLFKPFLLIQFLLIIAFTIKTGNIPIGSFIKQGGFGWGAYYPTLFFQIIVITPFMYKLLDKNFIKGGVFILFAHILTEVFFNILGLPQFVYRLICTRYLFLFVIAYMIYKPQYIKRYQLYLLVACIIGFIYIYYSAQLGYDFGLYPSTSFRAARFPRDIVTLLLFFMLWKVYKFTPPNLLKLINNIGKHSYNIFLFQMTFFPLFSYTLKEYMIFNLIAAMIFSIGGGYLFKTIQSKLTII